MTVKVVVALDEPAEGPWYCGRCYAKYQILGAALKCPVCKEHQKDIKKRGIIAASVYISRGKYGTWIHGPKCGEAVNAHTKLLPFRILKHDTSIILGSKCRIQYPCLCRETRSVHTDDIELVAAIAVPKIQRRS